MTPALRTLFVILILFESIGAIGFVEADSDFTWLGLLITAGFTWTVVKLLKVPPWITAFAFFMLVLDAASALLMLYSKIQPWDRIMHTLGGLTIAAAVRELALRALSEGHVQARRPGIFLSVSVVLTTSGVGLFYEILEYLVDTLYFSFPKTLVSAYNTVEDQMFNLLGAAIILAFHFLGARGWAALRAGPLVAHASTDIEKASGPARGRPADIA